MKKNLIRNGSGWAIFMPKPILELLGINPEEDQIEMKVENEVLKITSKKRRQVKFSFTFVQFIPFLL